MQDHFRSSTRSNLIIVKVGGAAGVDLDAVCTDLAALAQEGHRWILMHGGSHETNELARRLDRPPRFVTSVSGYTSRYTDAAAMEIFTMVYCGKINKAVVERLRRQDVDAVGLSGLDGGLLRARRKGALKVREGDKTLVLRGDLSGRIEGVNTRLLKLLLDGGFYPVITPPAAGTDGTALNVDGDRAAAAVAAAMGADTLAILSDVPGLLRRFPDPESLVKDLPVSQVSAAAESWAQGRMRIKLLGAREAVEAGVERVILGDSRVQQPVRAALDGCGTIIRAD